MTVIDFSIPEMYKMLLLIQMIPRDRNDISLGHWKSIPENLVYSEINAKKKELYLTVIVNPFICKTS